MNESEKPPVIEGEFPVEWDRLAVFLKEKKLFHGSANPDTQEFITSEEALRQDLTDGSTFGIGLYATSSKQAADMYARRRVYNDENKERNLSATNYEITVDNLRMLNLRTQENISEFTQRFQVFLLDGLTKETFKDLPSIVRNSIIDALVEIGKGITFQNIQKITGYGMAGVFTRFAKSLGYEGAITIEGGEGEKVEDNLYIANHDTYVVFDPTKATINGKETLL